MEKRNDYVDNSKLTKEGMLLYSEYTQKVLSELRSPCFWFFGICNGFP